MKNHISWSKILTFFLCAMLLAAPLFQPALAADGEEENNPIVINSLPYSINQNFYQKDTGRTEVEIVPKPDGSTEEVVVPVYEKHFDYYYKHTVTRAGRMTVQLKANGVYCSASIAVNGVNSANVYTNGNGSAYVDLREGDVVTIHTSVIEDTKVQMDLTIADYPKGSKYNAHKTTLDELGSGMAINLKHGDSIYYSFVVPETGVLQFSTSDPYSPNGAVANSMPYQQQIIVNEDRISTFTSFQKTYEVVVQAGDTVTFATECPGYAADGGYTLYVEYVPPFLLDEKAQGNVFSGMYVVESTSNEDGSKQCMYAVRFNYGKKLITVMNVKDCVALGTYTWSYNLDTGALDIVGAPYGITVEEDATQDLGCYLKLHYNNGSYAMKPTTEEPKPSAIVAQLLNGKYEDVYNGKVYEVLNFDYAAGTLTIAKDWNSSKVTVYTMGAFDVFTGEMTYTDSKGESIQIGVSGGKVIYYNNPLTPVEAPHVHEYTSVVTAPTCTANGFTTYTCECGDTYTGDEIATSGHKYEAVVTAPTCTEGGYTTHTCSVCGDVKTDSQTEAAGHKYEAVVTAPTCTEGGYTTHTCSVCGDVKTDSQTAAAGHKYESLVTAPTCTEGGYTTHTCSVCGDVKTDSQTNATGHNYGAWTDAGEKHGKTCANCGDVISAEHTWDNGVVEKEPTEDENGSKKLTCTDCGAVKTQVIPALGHTHKYTSSTTAPTCTEAGYITYTCECGDTYQEAGEKALGHKYESVVTAPTCTEGGYTTHTCSVCGDVKTDSKTAAAGHKYDSVVTAPTCNEGGYTTHTCSVCGDVKTDSKTNAAGHKYESVVTAPTCTEGGYTTHTCSVCGDVQVDSQVGAAGHDYDNGVVADGQITYTCSACGQQYSEEWVVNALTVPGNMTGTVEGSMTFAWTATKDGHLVVDNVAPMTGAYVTVQINGVDAYPTNFGYAISSGDEVVITVTTYSELTFDIPVYIYEDQQGQDQTGPMEFEVTFDGWDFYEQTWVVPFTGTATFVISQSDVAAANLTFRVVDAAGNFYNQYEFGLDENCKQFVSVKVNEGDVLTIIAYADGEGTTGVGTLQIQVIEGEPVLHEHAYGEGVVTAPTCTTDGYTTYTCTGCGHTTTGDVVAASHHYEAVTTDPTCEAAGFVTFTCSECGYSYVEAGAGALNHSFGQWETVKEATTTEAGSRKRVCELCGKEETETIPMIETTPTTVPPTQPATQPSTTAPATQPATTGGDNANEPGGDSNMILIIAIVAVVVIGGIVAVVIIKKKK